MNPYVDHLISVLEDLLKVTAPVDWKAFGRGDVVDAEGVAVLQVNQQHRSWRANLQLIVQMRMMLPVVIREIRRLRMLMDDGGTQRADQVEAMDRMIGMVERAEAEADQVNEAFTALIELCPSCSELVEVPFGGCVHNRAGEPMRLIACRGQFDGGSRLCTCCWECAAECRRFHLGE